MILKTATVCTGIGSPEQALKNLGVKHEIVFGCEIDKYAKQTYLENFNPGVMLEDMTNEEWMGEEYYSDLFVGGIPCQAFSLAGKRLGELDPRGLLFFDFYRYVKNQKPKYFIIENVKGLLSMNEGEIFQNWINLLGQSVNGDQFMFPHEDSLMYNLHWQVLNTKDYGLPQNRERVFLIGIRNDLPNSFVFPKGVPLKLRLKDILEDEVDEKYYLSDENVSALIDYNKRQIENGRGFSAKFRDVEDVEIMDCLKVGGGGKDDLVKIKSATASGYEIATEAVGVMIGAMRGRNPENPSDRTTGAPTQKMLEINENGTSNCLTSVQKDNLVVEKFQEFEIADYRADEGLRIRADGISPCLTSSIRDADWTPQAGTRNPPITSNGYRIRKLTPLECFRLQGFPDEFVDKNNFIKSINKQGILVYICNELKNKLLCNAKLKNVIEKQREGDIALCTIKDSESMGTQISFLNTPTEEIKNVKYQVAINLFTQKDFVYHTTTPTENMETLYTLAKEGKMLSTELSHPVEKEELGNAVDQNTDLLLKITLDESWKKEKSYITSTLIHTIMKSATCMFMNQSQNTLRCIVSYEELPKKQKQPTKTSLAMESFILKTANTSYVSSSQLYKQAGNTISVDVIEAILKNLLKPYLP